MICREKVVKSVIKRNAIFGEEQEEKKHSTKERWEAMSTQEEEKTPEQYERIVGKQRV